ncbi:hypothetical protein [Oleidesulfovibrio sp.]|uniref:hypothetical protein n=1 Tax=Oleidesulfovibrio sp. TaxID=2909707 RepID=UPI003A86A43F
MLTHPVTPDIKKYARLTDSIIWPPLSDKRSFKIKIFNFSYTSDLELSRATLSPKPHSKYNIYKISMIHRTTYSFLQKTACSFLANTQRHREPHSLKSWDKALKKAGH